MMVLDRRLDDYAEIEINSTDIIKAIEKKLGRPFNQNEKNILIGCYSSLVNSVLEYCQKNNVEWDVTVCFALGDYVETVVDGIRSSQDALEFEKMDLMQIYW